MREIEKQMLSALRKGKNWKKANTRVECKNGSKFVFLHNNPIYANIGGAEYFCDCGWKTRTTASRLWALGYGSYSYAFWANNNLLTSSSDMRQLYRVFMC